ncbi:MAG: lactate utilization protein [Clostridia bacterium]|nr:lactate utilization protein [Clostridia bacterium]
MESKVETVLQALRRNRMQAYYAATAAEVPALVRSLLHTGDTVACGGSQTLAQCGVMDLLQSGAYQYLDRHAPGTTPRQIYLQSFAADAYLCSANAVTLKGEIYNVDGNGNRVAALCYGPASVIIVAGLNKIVADLPAAADRVKRTAAPRNAARLQCNTYCAAHGQCAAADSDDPCDGCGADGRICSMYVTLGRQRVADRIKVILVGEPLGY